VNTSPVSVIKALNRIVEVIQTERSCNWAEKAFKDYDVFSQAAYKL
jgi:hypothetical protein